MPKRLDRPEPIWPERPSAAFYRQVRLSRIHRGLTQAQLAERLKEMGSTLDAADIAKIETGRRSAFLDEVIEVAAALGVCPTYLFLPREQDGYTLIAENLVAKAEDAREWIAGFGPLVDEDRDFYFDEQPERLKELGRQAVLEELGQERERRKAQAARRKESR